MPPNSIPSDTDEFTTIVLDNLFAALEVVYEYCLWLLFVIVFLCCVCSSPIPRVGYDIDEHIVIASIIWMFPRCAVPQRNRAQRDYLFYLSLSYHIIVTQERAAKFDEKGRPPLKRGLSAKSHSLFEAEDKAAEEMILTARKHLFMANNLYSVSNHLREIIEKGEDSATAKVTKCIFCAYMVILFQFFFANVALQ